MSTITEHKRSLARVAHIISLAPIPGADLILKARVLGWDIVVLKDEFQVGDLCVFFSIDSVLDPENPIFSKIKGRIKTCKIRGVISQGVAKPLALVQYYGVDPATLKAGDDLTQILKVTKYVFCEDVEANEQGSFGHGGKAAMPPGMHITGETRIQECGAMIQRLAETGVPVVIKRKEDGTSTSFYHRRRLHSDWNMVDPERYPQLNQLLGDAFTQARERIIATEDYQRSLAHFAVCGHHTVRTAATKESLHYFRMEARYDIERKMRELARDIIIQGEIVGPGIQSNRLALKELEFRVFYIWDIKAQCKLPWSETVALCRQLGLPTVPVIYEGAFQRDWTQESLLAWAAQLDYTPGKPAEGFVLTTNPGPNDHFAMEGFKVISNRFLLKNGL